MLKTFLLIQAFHKYTELQTKNEDQSDVKCKRQIHYIYEEQKIELLYDISKIQVYIK